MKRDYSDPDYKNWRKQIYARDKYTCQWPNCKNTKHLEAHHILKWNDYPGLRYNTDNGITLCRTHHRMVTGKEEYYIKALGDIVRSKK